MGRIPCSVTLPELDHPGPILTAGCTFEEASEPAVPCEFSQAQYDDFQWEQVRIHPGTGTPADLPHGEPALHQYPFSPPSSSLALPQGLLLFRGFEDT